MPAAFPAAGRFPHNNAVIQWSVIMTISASLKPLDLRDELEAANMKGKNLTFLDDYSKEELGHLFKAAELLEPYSKNQIPLMPSSYTP